MESNFALKFELLVGWEFMTQTRLKRSTKAKQKTREDRALTQCVRRINTALANEPFAAEAVFDKILEEARKLIKAKRGQLLLVHPDHLTIHATTGKEERGTPVALETSFCGKFVIKRRRAAIANDLRHPRYKGAYVDFLGDALPMLSELAVPVFVGKKIIGVLNFESHYANAFNQSHLQTVKRFADAAAIAFHMAAEATERAHLQKIHDAEERIQNTLAANPFVPDNVYDAILREARTLIDAERGQLILVHPDVLTIHATTGKEKRGMRVSLENSFCGKFVVSTGQYAIAKDLRDPKYEGAFVNILGEDVPMLSELAVPVFSGKEMIAIINVESPNLDAFDERDAEILTALANNTAIALLRATDRQFEEDLKELAGELAEADIPIDDWLKKVVERSADLMMADNAQFIEVEGDRLKIRAWAGREPLENLNLRLDNCITGQVAKTKSPLRIDDVNQPPWRENIEVSATCAASWRPFFTAAKLLAY
jgi:GAF domain-containing protein